MMGKTAFIWDLDGTLLDSYEIIVSSLHQTFREFNTELDKNEIYKELITYSLGVYLSKIEKERGLSSDKVKERFSVINDRDALKTKPVRHAAEILSFLRDRGIPNYVFTHKGATTASVLKNLGLYDYFEEIVTGKDGFPRKPDPAAVNYLIRKYGMDRDNTFYVGDRTLDIACAVNAGIKSVLYLPEDSYAVPDGRQTFIVKDLLDIRDILPMDKSMIK